MAFSPLSSLLNGHRGFGLGRAESDDLDSSGWSFPGPNRDQASRHEPITADATPSRRDRFAMAGSPVNYGPTAEVALPEYDSVDAARVSPGKKMTLEYTVGEGDHMGGITLENIDRSALGSISRLVGRSPFADMDLRAVVETPHGTITRDFVINGKLSRGEAVVLPWRDLPLQGPGKVTITATNKSPWDLAVTAGARKTSGRPAR